MASPAWALPKHPDAAKLLDEGQVKYKAEKFDAAIEDFKKGYEIEADPAFLIAWAQAERQRGRCAAAVRLYQKFLATNPPEVAQEFAREGIVRCAEQLAGDDPVPPGADELSASDDDDDDFDDTEIRDDTTPDDDGDDKAESKGKRWYRDPAGTTLVALGVVGAGVGAGLLAAAQVEQGSSSTDYGEFDARQRRVRNLRISGGVVLGVGAGMLIGGVIRWVIVGTRKSDAPAVGFILDRNQAGLTLSGRF